MRTYNFFTNNDSEKIFIIGNGFDLSLGLKTRYCDYASSNLWPMKFSNEYFCAYLNNCKKKKDWFDIEEILGKYENSMGNFRPVELNFQKFNPTASNDKALFQLLCTGLKNYLKQEQTKSLVKNSPAGRILKGIAKNGFFQKVYTFNYTDLSVIADKLEIDLGSIDIEHIHGSLKDGIVLGVPENIKLSPEYDFMYKTSSEFYGSHPLPYSLDKASEVVFFGHSMSDNDYFYFEDFFNKQAALDLKKEDGKSIIFFTYNEDSRLAIIRQLRKSLRNRLPQLISQNKFQIIKTDGTDEIRINAFLQHLEDCNIINSIIV